MTSTAPAPQGGAHATRTALAWAHTARFFTTAAQLDQLPGHDLPEIAFVGRSNAGKSTAINTVAQQRQLAFASKTPGRTQHINLFAVGPREAPDALWADLPGYGYAAVERAAKLRWQKVRADYLALRRNLAGETDSEVFFHHVLGGLHRRGVLDSQAPPREAVAAALMETVLSIAELSRAHTDQPGGLTCVLTDGHLTTAVCQGAPLFYVERRGPLPDDPGAPQRSQHTAVLRYVMLTSGDTAPQGYEAVPQGCVVVVGRDLKVEVLPCDG